MKEKKSFGRKRGNLLLGKVESEIIRRHFEWACLDRNQGRRSRKMVGIGGPDLWVLIITQGESWKGRA